MLPKPYCCRIAAAFSFRLVGEVLSKGDSSNSDVMGVIELLGKDNAMCVR